MKNLAKFQMVLALLIAVAVALPANAGSLYLDMNGTTAGFGLDGAVDPFIVDPTAATWTADATGVSSTTTFVAGEVAHFELSGTSGVLFNFANYTGTTFGGITTTLAAGSTATISRMQKQGGGLTNLVWASGAVVDTSGLATSFWWDLGTTGDYTKTGSNNLTFSDGGSKVNGTLTIDQGSVVVMEPWTVSDTTSFNFAGASRTYVEVDPNDTAVITLNTLYVNGLGQFTRANADSTLASIDITTNGGIDMANSAATDEVFFSWGSSITLADTATLSLDITKSGGVTDQDQVRQDWGSQPITVDGTLAVSLLGTSEALADGDTFDLFDYGNPLTGTFASVSLPTLSGGLSWDTSSLYATGEIAVVPEPATMSLLALGGMAIRRRRK